MMLALSACCLACTDDGWSAELSAEKVRRVDAIVARALADPAEVRPSKARAISISLSIKGEPVLEKGYGEARSGVPATAETKYLIGSVSKQFTAAAVLDAIEKGHRISGTRQRLELDTPVSAIFAGFDHWDRDVRYPMTVKRLLTMTSNLPNFTVRPPSGLDPWGAVPASHILGAFQKLRPADSWAGSFRYSNTSYFLLAEILDRTDGAPHSNYMANYMARVKELFRRAEMSKTAFVGELRSSDEVADPSYRRRPAFLKPDWLKGSGDLISTATDLRRWNAALMTGRILALEKRDAMFSEAAHVTPTMWYGMGWFIEDRPDRIVYSHSGFVPGYTALNLIVRPKKNPVAWRGIVILTNADETYDLDRIADDLAYVLFDQDSK